MPVELQGGGMQPARQRIRPLPGEAEKAETRRCVKFATLTEKRTRDGDSCEIRLPWRLKSEHTESHCVSEAGEVFMRWLIGSVYFSSIVLGATGAAIAADIPVKAPITRPVMAPAFSWSGCYVGANAGWIQGRSTIDTSPSGSYLTTAGVLAPPNPAGTGLLLGDFTSAQHSYSQNGSGAEVGAQVGCNVQFSSIVLGVEGDINWSSLKTSVNATFAPFPSANPAFTISQANESISTRMDWFSTIRARGGIAFDRWLVFATGGLAIGQFDSSTNVTYGANGTSPVFANASHVGSSSVTRFGLAVGGGLEYAFSGNWSAKAEYLYLDFGSWSYASPLVAPAGSVGAGYTWSTTVSQREHIVRLGINYRFGDPAPVVARY
jgi:outer membrane immunogenic protein